MIFRPLSSWPVADLHFQTEYPDNRWMKSLHFIDVSAGWLSEMDMDEYEGVVLTQRRTVPRAKVIFVQAE